MLRVSNSEQQTLFNVTIYYAALIFNIFLGWIIAKLNTEYLSVADYGRYSFFIIFIYFSRAFFGFGVMEGTSRLVAICQNSQEVKRLTGTSLSWILLFFIPLTVFLYLGALVADSIFEVKISSMLLVYAPFAGIILMHSHLNLLFRGWGRVGLMALMTILPRTIYIFLLAYLIYFSVFNLETSVSTWITGFFLAVTFIILYLRPSFDSLKQTSLEIYHEVRTYGIYLYVSNIWHEIFFHADKFVISYFLSEESMAYYALGYMITFPLTYFSTALATSLFKKFAGQKKINSKVFLLNGIFILLSVTGFILLRKYIILYLFSAEYLATIDLIIPLALAFGFSGLSKPFSLYLMARKHGKTVRNISVFIPLLHIMIGLYIIPKYGIIGAAWVATGVYFLDMILYMISYFRVRAV